MFQTPEQYKKEHGEDQKDYFQRLLINIFKKEESKKLGDELLDDYYIENAEPYVVCRRWDQLDKLWHIPHTIQSKTCHRGAEAFKFHLSIKRDKTNLAKAWRTILPILKSKGVKTFKFAYNIYNHGDTDDGKEMCVYNNNIPGDPETQSQFWLGDNGVITQIVAALEKEGVEAGNPSTADIPVIIDGNSKQFAYVRTANNILGSYVYAKHISSAGFTAIEAANLGNSDLVSSCTLALQKRLTEQQNTELVIPQLSASNQENVQQLQPKILNSYLYDTLSCYLKFIIFGDLSIGYERIKQLLKHLFVSTGSKKFDEYDRIFGLVQFTQLNPYEIYSLLEDAAQITAIIVDSLSKDHTISFQEKPVDQSFLLKEEKKTITGPSLVLGNITPTLYHCIYKPLLLRLQNNLEATENKYEIKSIDDIWQHNPIDTLTPGGRAAMIQEIVKCSLRDPNVAQISLVSPQYINQYTEKQVHSLVSQAIQYAAKIHKKEQPQPNPHQEITPTKIEKKQEVQSKLLPEPESPQNIQPSTQEIPIAEVVKAEPKEPSALQTPGTTNQDVKSIDTSYNIVVIAACSGIITGAGVAKYMYCIGVLNMQSSTQLVASTVLPEMLKPLFTVESAGILIGAATVTTLLSIVILKVEGGVNIT